MKPFYRIIIVISVIAGIFLARLAYLQLLTDRYALNAANTSIKKDYIIPQRGIIFDRNGKILVGNQPSYELSYTEALMKTDFDTLGFCNLVRITKTDFINRIKKLKSDKYFSKLTPITFMKNLSRDDIARIQEIIFNYPAFNVVSRPQREYNVSTSGNLLGYTNEVNEFDIKKDSTYYQPGDNIGKTGVEKAYEKTLRGEKGVKYIQKDIKLRNIGPYKDGKLDQEVKPGEDITLTIDYDLQKLAEEMLVNKRGAIVALNPKTGEILCLATGPDIDPKAFTGSDKNKEISKLLKDKFNQPMFDRSIQAGYPPGSTFKIMTALAGLQMGVITPETTFSCPGGSFVMGGVRIKGHGGNIPLVPSMAISSNCYFSHAYLNILNKYPGNPDKSINEWADIMHSFGLGQFMNNDLAVGSKGLIPDSAFYHKRFGKTWKPLSVVFNGMGQGDILLTPLQIANFTAATANKGWFYTPHIVKLVNGKPNPDKRFYVKHYTKVDKKYFDVVLKGMEAVVQSGTARGLRTSEFTQMAKTGTAQVPQGKDNSIFTLIAPAENPQIVVVAVIEHAGFGATWAGPACTLIAEKYITGEVKRVGLYNKMVNSSFMPEYRRQWIEQLRKKGILNFNKDRTKVTKMRDSLKLQLPDWKRKQMQKKVDSLQKLLELKK